MKAKGVEERGREIDATDKIMMMTSIIRRVDRTYMIIMFVKVIMKVEVAFKRSIAFRTRNKKARA